MTTFLVVDQIMSRTTLDIRNRLLALEEYFAGGKKDKTSRWGIENEWNVGITYSELESVLAFIEQKLLGSFDHGRSQDFFRGGEHFFKKFSKNFQKYAKFIEKFSKNFVKIFKKFQKNFQKYSTKFQKFFKKFS